MSDTPNNSELKPQRVLPKLQQPTRLDWGLLMVLVFLGGTSFAGIKAAVETASPVLVAAGRLWIAALFMLVYTYATGRKLPPLRDQGRLNIAWVYMIIGGFIAYVIPFILFPMAQQTIDSMVAGIYMAFMPLMTVVIGYFFADEELNRKRFGGFLLGTLGVVFLMGPSVLKGFASSDFVAQIVLLIAVLGYSIGAVLVRLAPPMPARSFATGTLICSSIMMIPILLLVQPDTSTVSTSSWMAIVYLGIFPTGVTSIAIFTIIPRAGPGFMVLGNYLAPLVAISIGVLMFNEAIELRYGVGLVAILIGLWLSQPRRAASIPFSSQSAVPPHVFAQAPEQPHAESVPPDT